MATANEKLFDEFVKQQVQLMRMSRGEIGVLMRVIGEADAELHGRLVSQLKNIRGSGRSVNFTTKQYKAMVQSFRKTRASMLKLAGKDIERIMSETVKVELDASLAILRNATPVQINFAAPSLTATRELTAGSPFGSVNSMQTLEQWIGTVAIADSNRLVATLQAGFAQGETIPQIEARLNDAFELTKQNVNIIVRTGINHASNTARGEVFKENSDVISALRWTSTLDGRTSAICRDRDGRMGPADGTASMDGVPEPHLSPPDATPPAHPRCRSTKIALLDGQKIADGLPNRPTMTDTRTGAKRQIDFERQARAQARADGRAWSGMSNQQKRPYRKDVRSAWAKEHIGRVPGETTYDQWLRRQEAKFQDDVLGKAKGKMYRDDPGMTMANFVDRRGNELTLAELAEVSSS